MRTIKEIKSIEVILEDDRNHFNIKFNGEAVDDYHLEIRLKSEFPSWHSGNKSDKEP